MIPKLYISCICCGKAVEQNHGEGGTIWVHLDGYRQCIPTYASPNFDRSVSKDGTFAQTRLHA